MTTEATLATFLATVRAIRQEQADAALARRIDEAIRQDDRREQWRGYGPQTEIIQRNGSRVIEYEEVQ